jgi:hypothetical protein
MERTRLQLHRVAAHVLGRSRFAASGHFGLRASPGGISTPAFGPEPEVLRLAGTTLVREVGAGVTSVPMTGATLADLASFAGADLAADFSAGTAMPAADPVDAPLDLDADDLAAIVGWFDLGWRVLDGIVADTSLADGWSTVQLWPEHLDAGASLDRGDGRGVNLGFSAGDAFCAEPYAYVGPWESARPGDPAYWNAPFGAVLPRSAGTDGARCDAFLRRGLELLLQE